MRPPVRRRGALLVLAVLLAAGLSGCAGEEDVAEPPAAVGTGTELPGGEPMQSEASTAAPAPQPCSLITHAEAERLAGTPLNEPVEVRDSCQWSGPVTGPTAQVELYVGDGAKKTLDINRELGHDLVSVTGVGDEAYLDLGDGSVIFRVAESWVALKLVRLNDPEENRKPLTTLAGTVAGRL